MTNQIDPVVIVGYARTPIGKFQGCFKACSADQLGAFAIKSALQRAGLPGDVVDEVYMGCILTAGIGQAPARQAALKSGLPDSVGCTTLNKMCGSGMKAIMLGHDTIKAGGAKIVVTGGMESMSNAPYLLPKAREGLRIGHSELVDHIYLDGLEDPSDHRLMGCFAEDCAEKFQLTRTEQDSFAKRSLQRALNAIESGHFSAEITPVRIETRKSIQTICHDEYPSVVDTDKISHLNPVFKKNGTVTAANSSGIADGAAAIVLMSRSEAEKRGVRPLAKILGHQSHAQQPSWFTTAPVPSIRKVLDKLDLRISDIDLFEINEAFAVVVLFAMQELGLAADQVNVEGGACALGHPIGASGARIVVTLLSAMERYDLRRGVASLCIGGGEATAMVIER